MNVKDLKSFEAVYEERGINQAAQKLFITPQGLSRNIKMLESELDTVLFVRTKQGVRPTESAELLHERAGILIREFEEIRNGIQQLKNEKRLLRIGCACGVFNVLSFPVIQRFIDENPEISVEWCEYSNQEVKERLKDSTIEYGFVVGAWKENGVKNRRLAGCRVCLLVYEGHPFYDLEEVTIDMVRGEKLILMNEYFHMYHDFLEACEVRGFKPLIAAKTADANFQYQLCRQKTGLAVVPDFAAEHFRMDHMRAIPFRERLRWEVYGVYKENNGCYSVIRALEDFLRSQSADFPEE